jgi:hypothetical protein
LDKICIVAKIIEDMTERGARFLKCDTHSSKWYEVSRKAVIEKVRRRKNNNKSSLPTTSHHQLSSREAVAYLETLTTKPDRLRMNHSVREEFAEKSSLVVLNKNHCPQYNIATSIAQ